MLPQDLHVVRAQVLLVHPVERTDDRAHLGNGQALFLLSADAADDQHERQRREPGRVDLRRGPEVRLEVRDRRGIDHAKPGALVGVKPDRALGVRWARRLHLRDQIDRARRSRTRELRAVARRGERQRTEPAGEAGPPMARLHPGVRKVHDDRGPRRALGREADDRGVIADNNQIPSPSIATGS